MTAHCVIRRRAVKLICRHIGDMERILKYERECVPIRSPCQGLVRSGESPCLALGWEYSLVVGAVGIAQPERITAVNALLRNC